MNNIFLGVDIDNQPVEIFANMINRHGLITGATGTGKTVTLKILAEEFSKLGIPVVLTDVKGDLSGIASLGQTNDIIEERVALMQLTDFQLKSYPCQFWDIYGKQGLNLKTTVTEIGPLLLSRVLKLNETQESILLLAFKIADDEGLLLLDIKDITSFMQWLEKNRPELEPEYGMIATASIRAIQRKLLVLADAGANLFLGEPAIDINDLMTTDDNGIGTINLINATKLIHDKRLYTTCLLYLLSELFSNLDEVGDLDKPRLVFFFDEAHLLFNDAPKELLDKVEQVVRLIRSKGVGVYFISQSPADIPENILGQLGNRIQHALRAFTPKDQKAIKAAADSFRQNPKFNTKKEIMNLGIGQALVSVLDPKGMPTIVAKTIIKPPESSLKPTDDKTIDEINKSCNIYQKYAKPIDRQSAYEVLKQQADKEIKQKDDVKYDYKPTASKSKSQSTKRKSIGRPRQSMATSVLKSAARAIGSQVGRSLVRSLLGSLFKR